MKKTSSVLDDGMSLEGSAAELRRAAVHHFDQLVDLYGELWGQHIHRRYWDLDRPYTEIRRPITRNPWLMLRLLRAKGLAVLRAATSVPPTKRLHDEGIIRCGVFRATKPQR
ncbi:hypothetical protein [Streptomyces griseosporeus]|uniref:hypothetical protein n=1 Tax=Streptomyces griseosporeus TaxID=1910 RepID=UPI00167D8BBB|nr:hypothetical protein [Streptomyces griseosporeus]GHF50592.1 hypothetical protein GCM10018783_19000 [Streptomyces griseosporeus]